MLKSMQLNDWNATRFFADLVKINRLAKLENFTFCSVSGLEGFEQTLHSVQTAKAFCCVSDIADGFTELDNTPHTRRVKTVFLAMRHAVDYVEARNECMETMRELFRQFMSALNLERIRLQQNCIYLDRRISFTEIDRYFFSGCACAYFQIAADVYTDISFNFKEWSEVPGGNLDLWLLEAPSEEDRRAAASEFMLSEFGFSENRCEDYYFMAPVCILENVSEDALEKIIPTLRSYGCKFKFVPHGKYFHTPLPLYNVNLVKTNPTSGRATSYRLLQQILECDLKTAKATYDSAPCTILTETDIDPIRSQIDSLIALGNVVELEFVRNVNVVYHLWLNFVPSNNRITLINFVRNKFGMDLDVAKSIVFGYPSLVTKSFNLEDFNDTISAFENYNCQYEVKAYDAEP